MTFGELLRAGLEALRRHAVGVAGVAIVGYAGLAAYAFLVDYPGRDAWTVAAWLRAHYLFLGLFMLTSALMSIFVIAPIAWIVAEGRGVAAAFQARGGRQVLWTVSLAWLGIGVGLLLVVPGLRLAGRWYVAGPAAAVEKLDVHDALRRSEELTRGCRGALAGLYVAVSALALAVALALDLAFVVRHHGVPVEESWTTFLAIHVPIQALAGALNATFAAAAYRALRERRATVTDVERVFA